MVVLFNPRASALGRIAYISHRFKKHQASLLNIETKEKPKAEKLPT